MFNLNKFIFTCNECGRLMSTKQGIDTGFLRMTCPKCAVKMLLDQTVLFLKKAKEDKVKHNKFPMHYEVDMEIVFKNYKKLKELIEKYPTKHDDINLKQIEEEIMIESI